MKCTYRTPSFIPQERVYPRTHDESSLTRQGLILILEGADSVGRKHALHQAQMNVNLHLLNRLLSLSQSHSGPE